MSNDTSNKMPHRKVILDSTGKSAHTESPIDIEVEETDTM